jgi:hypothetical protein
MDRAHANEAPQESAMICFCVQSKQWKGQVSATFWGCMMFFSLRICFD